MKVCKSCGEQKELSGFPKDRNQKDGYFYYCKTCNNKRAREFHNKRPVDIKRYRQYVNALKMKYNITEEEIRLMMDNQKGCCAICGKSLVNPKYKPTDMNVDHNHTTGKVRGLLCVTCNFTVGQLEIKGRREMLKRYIDGV